ncbi:Phosphoglucosamine mutase [Halorhabdus utahensis DSM 12940]|uniref:Phosphoglucosamine mutase n=1 Tax=Halorhabdus utahensis (strain DSM 12940 / JCM 11049 / AX-2) TaxID=519442 RepID=C7NV08_HALUD|nr:phosphoglucosamine mutase [Halorhabdus utahensis]ACV12420.1 Phosphoglucosamine mutase [Halorhabdus utahensis DSM 12940]
MFGTSGIRGPVGETVTADLALSVGRALGIDADRVVVGRDPRESGRFLLDALTAGLRESGTDVIDLGVAATPTVARAVRGEDGDAGVVITASHNPPADNGIKLWQPTTQAFDTARQNTVADRIESEAFDLVAWDDLGTRRRRDGADAHVEAILDAVSVTSPPDVVVDLGNGAGGVSVEALTQVGCDVETLNAQPDGAFPGRPSEPTAENCESLTALARETGRLGIAHDGDADRLRAVTEDGEFLSGDTLLAILARDAADPGETVAAPVNTSLAVDDYLAADDIDVVRTRVGDVSVAERASEPGVAFGGEPSGAWIWPAQALCPDGPLAAAKLVELAAERPLADRVDDIEAYPIHRDSVSVTEKAAVMERIHERVQAEYDDVTTLDGVRVDLGDAWFLLRASGTQPLIRITAEARDPERANTVFEEAREIVTRTQG